MPPFAPEDEREPALLEQHAKLERELDGLRGRADDGAAERRANIEAAMERIDEQLSEGREKRVQRQHLASLAGSPRHEDRGVIGEHSSRSRPQEPRPLGDDPGAVSERARRTIDALHGERALHDEGAHKADRLVADGPLRERTTGARWVEVASDPNYLSAFRALVADPERGHLHWSEPERRAFGRVQEYRAMSLTGNAGGFMVPFTLDPAIMLTNAGSISPLRQLARVVVTATDQWHGVTSAGVTAEWLAESTEAADATPTLAQPEIDVFKGSAFLPFSIEVGMDAMNFDQELGKLLSDGADRLWAEAYMTGSGVGEPAGLATGLDATAVDTASAQTLVATDVVGVQNVLPPRFQAGASWVGSLAFINDTASIETTNGALRFPELSASPPMLLRKPIYEDSHLDAPSDASVADADVAVYGDISQAFVIVDRTGTTVELVPHLVGANRRPTGERGAFMFFRTGSEVVIADAARLLRVTNA